MDGAASNIADALMQSATVSAAGVQHLTAALIAAVGSAPGVRHPFTAAEVAASRASRPVNDGEIDMAAWLREVFPEASTRVAKIRSDLFVILHDVEYIVHRTTLGAFWDGNGLKEIGIAQAGVRAKLARACHLIAIADDLLT